MRRCLGLLSLGLLACTQAPTPPASPSSYPPALLDFMMHNWAPTPATATAPLATASNHRARRQALAALFPQAVLVIPSGTEKTRSADQKYPFRPGSDFYYLTGDPEPGAVLILAPQAGGTPGEWLYVAPRRLRNDARFFTDYSNGELWVGPRQGVPESQARYEVSHTESLDALPERLKTLRDAYVVRGLDAGVDAALSVHAEHDRALGQHLAELRLTKDAHEQEALRDACAITARGFDDVLRTLPTAHTEGALAAAFTHRATVEGNDNGYQPVVAAGPHATILHWSHGREALPAQGLLLLDMGAESEQYYSADITRTVPLGGHFSAAQRQVYEAVLAAQDAAIAAVQPGAKYLDPHRAAMAVLTDHLVQWGILTMPAGDALDPNHGYYKRYTLHGVSHMLGLDVHDCGQARDEVLKNGTLKPGMVLTVEPGLYFQANDLSVPEAWRGIGVRIEDDVLVTATGHEVLSHLPRSADDVEAWMQQQTQTR